MGQKFLRYMRLPPWRAHNSCVEVSARAGEKAVAATRIITSACDLQRVACAQRGLLARVNEMQLACEPTEFFTTTRRGWSWQRPGWAPRNWNGDCNLPDFHCEEMLMARTREPRTFIPEEPL